MVLKNPSALLTPSNEQLLKWGADFGPLTLDDQPWRMITAGFLHIGIIHIAVNMWSLWVLGKIAERFVGPTSLVVIYLLTDVGAALASLAWDPARVSAGASGPIFGFIGAMIGILYFAKDRLDANVRKGLLNWVVRIAVINLFIGLKSGIDNMAHAGGLVTGAAIGAALALTAKGRSPEERVAMRRNVFIGTAALLAILFVPIRNTRHDVVYAYHAQVAMEGKDYAAAIASLKQLIQREPSDPYAHALLGEALYFEKDYANALAEDQRSLQLYANQPEVKINMALVYVAQGNGPEAVKLFDENMGKIKPDADVYKGYGEALLLNNDAERAEQMLRKALEIDNRNADTHSDLARALTLQGRTPEAAAESRDADELRKASRQK
jgi:rhomboid protease GluP